MGELSSTKNLFLEGFKVNAKWLDKRLAKCPPASWREETRILEEFNRIRLVKERKNAARRGLRESQAQFPPRVIIYHQESKPVTTQGTMAQDGADDGGGGSTEGSSEGEGDPDRPKKRESVFKKFLALLRRFSGESR